MNDGHRPTAPAHPLAPARTRPAAIATVFVLIVTAALLLALPRPLGSDVSGQLWIAHRLREGARLYLDIKEVNPPLWFWLAVPVDAAAGLLGLPPETPLIAAVAAAALASLLALDRLLPAFPPAARAGLLAYGALLFLVMPLRDFGQREQLVLIAAVPYAALAALRRERGRVPGWLALAIGVGAALGFALKHYFVVVPVLLELWLILGLRRSWRPVRAETAALAAAALGYGAAILIVTPGFLAVSVPESTLAYAAVGASRLRDLIRPAQILWVLLLYAVVAQRAASRRAMPPLVVALLIAAAGFSMAWAMQHKGWPYQSVATTGMLAFALGVSVASEAVRVGAWPRAIVVLASVLPLLLCLIPTQWKPEGASDIAPALADLKAGDAVAILSVEGRTEWPSTVGRGLAYPARWPSLWVLPAVDANRRVHDPRIDRLGRQVIDDTVADLRCRPPKRIVFYPGRGTDAAAAASDDPARFFLHDPRFARLLGHYRRLPLTGGYDAYAVERPVPGLPPSLCRRGP